MAYYVNGILIGGANTLPKMTMAEYLALPVSERPTYWECTDKDYVDISAENVSYGSGTVADALDDLLLITSGTATGETGKVTINTQTIKKMGKLVIFTIAFTSTSALAPSDVVFTLPWTPDSRYDFLGVVASTKMSCTFATISAKQVQLNVGTINSSEIVFVSGSYITTD